MKTRTRRTNVRFWPKADIRLISSKRSANDPKQTQSFLILSSIPFQIYGAIMDSAKVNDWVQVVGIFAVVASLIFVGLQMKQAHDIAIAEQYQTRAIYGAEHLGSFVENEHMLETVANQFKTSYESGDFGDLINNDYEAFGPEYVAIGYILAMKGLVTMDNFYFQYQRGFMEEEAWAAFRYRLKGQFSEDSNVFFYRIDPQQWRNSFQELCTELIAEIEAETSSAD